MTKERLYNHLKQIGMEIIGSLFVAAGIYNFAVNANFPVSGFSGISLILYQVFGLPIGLTTIVLNIPVGIICYKLIGKRFFISSVRCMVISSLFIDYLAPLFPVYDGSRLLAAICTGVLSGLGYAIIYMQNSSTGGTDFVSMAIKAKNPHLPIGKITFAIDVIIIFAGGFSFSDVDGIIYGILVSYILALMADKLMYGINSGKLTFIVCDDGQGVCNLIDETVGRGSTIVPASGGFHGDDRQVVMCACSDKEMYLVQKAVKEKFPESFIIVLESNEVHGEGFHTLLLGEKES